MELTGYGFDHGDINMVCLNLSQVENLSDPMRSRLVTLYAIRK